MNDSHAGGVEHFNSTVGIKQKNRAQKMGQQGDIGRQKNSIKLDIMSYCISNPEVPFTNQRWIIFQFILMYKSLVENNHLSSFFYLLLTDYWSFGTRNDSKHSFIWLVTRLKVMLWLMWEIIECFDNFGINFTKKSNSLPCMLVRDCM